MLDFRSKFAGLSLFMGLIGCGLPATQVYAGASEDGALYRSGVSYYIQKDYHAAVPVLIQFMKVCYNYEDSRPVLCAQVAAAIDYGKAIMKDEAKSKKNNGGGGETIFIAQAPDLPDGLM